MKQAKAEQQWKRGYIQESLGHVSEAIQAAWRPARSCRNQRIAHIVDLFLKYDLDLHKAEELARRAVAGEPIMLIQTSLGSSLSTCQANKESCECIRRGPAFGAQE